ncbi:ROK family protein [Paenibacillus abyssi]|uniref:Sugar kinase n=1 Tax=Paenibacillus abyssi TaxID=1340531 RepID=A0A917G161_9BACL|nr:ROK family protein [Paenibacillus abyssi]GGG17280.1 sugar kinase [Paenibacillus abyssi]
MMAGSAGEGVRSGNEEMRIDSTSAGSTPGIDERVPGVFIGIDVGGTGIKGGLVTSTGELLLERSVRTPVQEGRDGILRELGQLALALIAASERPVLGIGVGSAGSIDPVSGGVIFATDNLPGWTGTPLAAKLSERTGLPVRADNDVNVAAIGEAWTGAAKRYDSFAFAALGTGVGGALFSGGRIIHGFQGRSGEIGHLILKPGGLPCNCGQKGCLEQYASGTALNRIARGIDPQWTSYTLMERYGEKEARAVEAVEAFVSDLASGLISLYHVFGPEAIVLGGGLIETADLWWDRLEQALCEMSQKPIIIERAKLGNQAGIIGAAYLGQIAANV